MGKKESLFLFIKSLSKSEKRYFRIYAGMNRKEANYLRLFDAVEQQEEYDEEGIRRKLEGQKFLSQLHVTKIYLTGLILKALRNYHADFSVSTKLLDQLKDIELLFDKALYDLCYYRISKAESLAAKFEKLSLHAEILFWKRKLALAVSASREDIHALLITEKKAIEQMQVLNSYWRHTISLGNPVNDGNFLKGLARTKEPGAYTLQSQVLHHHILYGIHVIKGETKKAEKHISALIRLLEKHPDRISEDPNAYVTAIGNKVGLFLSGKRWREIPALLSKIREVPVRYKLKSASRFTVRLWLRTFNVELEMYRDARQLEKGIVLINEIHQFIVKRRKAVPPDYILLLYYQFANIFFLNKEYTKSLRWLNEIINTSFGDTRKDIQSYARILNLMVHFELNNIIVLRYAVDSVRRFLKKKKFEINTVKPLLNLFSKLSHAYPQEHAEIFARSYAEMFPENTKQSQDYIDIKGWLEEKIKI
ncbi:MAG TPA: hypothetical protein VD816_04175 [Ohtaekwangia sp.]|nr:hypothetical protein [Ohtaekwangia sp.]